ncbi:hypothetical protein [Branchiibius sp. NY16-3462-2]|uniref:hypothetical protein n=1 Tax=Branchiibius sp. NY16-3462-2 TaxID=1807500 RepID=UPI000792EF6E|nr:hypothetical protein [Branchiibius sp. NY16-3462-2]KYH45611.1 hypothetical protein AZH51_17990 [Branchiibius sp. NY16-3462-2]
MPVMVVVLSRAAEADVVGWPDPSGPVWILRPGATELAGHVGRHRAESVVVLTRPQDARAGRLAMTVAAGANPATRFAMRVAPVSVLALAALGRQAVGTCASAADVLRWVDAHLDDLLSGVCLTRVGKLDRPSPGIWQHLRSMLPGSPGFVVTFGDQARVSSTPLEVAQEATLLVGASDPAAAAPQLQGARPVTVPPAVSTQECYGSAGAEFVALPRPRELPPARTTCRICDEPSDDLTCPFCHVVLNPQEHVA